MMIVMIAEEIPCLTEWWHIIMMAGACIAMAVLGKPDGPPITSGWCTVMMMMMMQYDDDGDGDDDDNDNDDDDNAGDCLEKPDGPPISISSGWSCTPIMAAGENHLLFSSHYLESFPWILKAFCFDSHHRRSSLHCLHITLALIVTRCTVVQCHCNTVTVTLY